MRTARSRRAGCRRSRWKSVSAPDVSAALQFYRSVYGDLGVNHFYATEIAEQHGEAFPGFINLSYTTFVATDRSGDDEIFRAHEVAHQWWGIGVDFASYRDQWLSEGLSTFSGLWYLQVVRKDSKPYFNQLRLWKTSIIDRSDDARPDLARLPGDHRAEPQ